MEVPENRPELEARSLDRNLEENGRYKAYNPNFVPTKEGYRVELGGRETYGNNNDIRRISHPSHYRNVRFTQNNSSAELGEVHSQRNFSTQLENPLHPI